MMIQSTSINVVRPFTGFLPPVPPKAQGTTVQVSRYSRIVWRVAKKLSSLFSFLYQRPWEGWESWRVLPTKDIHMRMCAPVCVRRYNTNNYPTIQKKKKKAFKARTTKELLPWMVVCSTLLQLSKPSTPSKEPVMSAAKKKKAAADPLSHLEDREDNKRFVRMQAKHHAGVEESVAQMHDTAGNMSRPVGRVRDTVDVLMANGFISPEEHEAAKRFGWDFHRANLDTLKSVDYEKVPGGSGEPEHMTGMLDARERVNKAVNALGGIGQPAGSIIWNVVGLQRTMKRYATEFAFCNGSSLNESTVKGMLVCALGALALHYGLKRQ